MTLTKDCVANWNPTTQQLDVTFTATLTNTGTFEAITITGCTDSDDATLSGVPASLAPGASAVITGSYSQGSLSASDTMTCNGQGSLSATAISRSDSAECSDTTNPNLTLDKSCVADWNSTTQQLDVTFSATLTNTGDETMTSISCIDSDDATLSGVPASLAPGASAVITGSYSQASLSASDTMTCNGTGATTATARSANDSAQCSDTTNPNLTLDKSCVANFNPTTQQLDVTFSATLTNTGDETMTSISCIDSDDATLSGVPASLAPGASAVITGSYSQASAQASDTMTCNGTGATSGTADSATDSAECSDTPPTPSACRMTGGHVNQIGDLDAGFSDAKGKYTTGGQIGAPNESGCCDFPHPKGICVNNKCWGGGEPDKVCTRDSDCPQTETGCNADCPWGDWQHSHHSGLDDSQLTKGGSFSFHSGTAAAPKTSFISNVICADEGWCVQARPAPDKQIFWEGYGVFHNLKGPKGESLSQPGFPAGCNVQVYDSKTGGTVHYYRAHVGDFGESKGPGQRQAPVTQVCEDKNFDAPWDIGCGSVDPVTLLGGVPNQKFTDLHPLCKAQDCTTCPDWYEIEISCDMKKPGEDSYQAAYKVAHFILQGNFQLHPAVCTSCQPCGDGLCETIFEETCESCCKDCCSAECP
jgi:hypothetical protein